MSRLKVYAIPYQDPDKFSPAVKFSVVVSSEWPDMAMYGLLSDDEINLINLLEKLSNNINNCAG